MNTPDITMIPVGKLVADSSVNTRPTRPGRVKAMGEVFDPDLIGVIHVSPRDGGTYAVIDGLHRVGAAQRANGADYAVPCIVHKRIRSAKQAAIFVGLNDSSKVPPLYSFRAEVVAGKPEAVAISEICDLLCLTIDPAPRDGNIAAVNAMRKIYRGAGNKEGKECPKDLRTTLEILIDAWGAKRATLNGSVVEGTGLVVLRYGDQLDPTRLSSKLAAFRGGPSNLLGRGRTIAEVRGGGVARGVAATEVDIYNKGTRSGGLASWWA